MIKKNEKLSQLVKNLNKLEFSKKTRRDIIKHNFIFCFGRAFYYGNMILEETESAVEKGLKKQEATEYIEKRLREDYNKMAEYC